MKYLLSFFTPLLFLSSCSDQLLRDKDDTAACPEMACTYEFRSATVFFKNRAGNGILVQDFSSVVRRTGLVLKAGATDTVNSRGHYSVVDDNDRKNLLSTGDIIDVSAVNPQTKQKKTIQFVVAGGKCACHIEKISGPEEVVF